MVVSDTANFGAVATTSGTTIKVAELRATAKENVASLKAFAALVTNPSGNSNGGGGGSRKRDKNSEVPTHAKIAKTRFAT